MNMNYKPRLTASMERKLKKERTARESSFSQMGKIKDKLQIKMGQRRLNMLSLLAIESELVKELHFDDLLDESVRRKSKKRKKSPKVILPSVYY